MPSFRSELGTNLGSRLSGQVPVIPSGMQNRNFCGKSFEIALVQCFLTLWGFIHLLNKYLQNNCQVLGPNLNLGYNNEQNKQKPFSENFSQEREGVLKWFAIFENCTEKVLEKELGK